MNELETIQNYIKENEKKSSNLNQIVNFMITSIQKNY